MTSSVEAKLEVLGLSLPPSKVWASANRTGAIEVGNLLFVSGHTPPRDFKDYDAIGKVGAELTREQGRHAALGCILGVLRSVKDAIGDLDRVERVVKLLGFVNSAPGFHQQFAVIDGASDLLIELWGDNGVHARSAIGIAELPRGRPVEIEAVFQLK